MAAKPPAHDIDESRLHTGERKHVAVGVPAIVNALKVSVDQMGVTRSAQALLRVNQKDGFDCPGCAWPETDARHIAEFCENGAKAVAEEATLRHVGPAFFAHHSVADLLEHDDYWLGQQGRLTTPMILDEGATHYRPIAWDAALDEIAGALRGLDDPNEAVFYTSGRTSNEAAFLYQLMVRGVGTNNLPDCSNMCHESSGSALTQTLGIGKGTVSIEDIHNAELLIIAGQNPGTNHPRMLTALEKAKQNGARIIAINPLPEAGLMRFENPQTPRGVLLGGTKLADQFVQIRLGGDQALFQAVGKRLLELEGEHMNVLDHEFIEQYTSGFDAYRDYLATLTWAEVAEATGVAQQEIYEVADAVAKSNATIVCWAMGLTQHPHSVPMLRDIVNMMLLRGNVGKPGAGLCPVRGHSNVQGDRTMGINEHPTEKFLAALSDEFAFTAPRPDGYDVVGAIEAMRDRKIKVFMAVGGNFVSATPDTEVTEAALRNTGLTVQVSTKLNRSHLVTGKRAIILPTLGRTDRDKRAGGDQKVTVEDSMSAVHGSHGRLVPPSADLLSEVAIIARLSERLFTGEDALPDAPQADWPALEADYRGIRTHIEHVIPGFTDYEKRIEGGRTFVLPNGPRDSRTFATKTGKAMFTVNPVQYPRIPAGRLLLQTIRSHDQYNTTIYGHDDRYRGIYSGRRVVLINADDLRELGFAADEIVDVVSEWKDGVERRGESFRLVPYSTPRGNAATYFPEANVLVPLGSYAETSRTPASKSIVVRLEHRAA